MLQTCLPDSEGVVDSQEVDHYQGIEQQQLIHHVPFVKPSVGTQM